MPALSPVAQVGQGQEFHFVKNQFPRLGTVTCAPNVPGWGPTAVVTPAQLSSNNQRTGTAELFDSSHPRNTFAKKHTHQPAVVSHPSASVAIDWSATGQPEVGTNAHALAVAAGNAAHVSPFVEQRATQPSMSVLQAMPQVQY